MINELFKKSISSLPGGMSAHVFGAGYWDLYRNFWDDLFYCFVILMASIMSGLVIQIYRDWRQIGKK